MCEYIYSFFSFSSKCAICLFKDFIVVLVLFLIPVPWESVSYKYEKWAQNISELR